MYVDIVISNIFNFNKYFFFSFSFFSMGCSHLQSTSASQGQWRQTVDQIDYPLPPTLHMTLPKAPSLPPWDPLAWCKCGLQITRLVAVRKTRRRNLHNARWLCSYSGPWGRILKTNYVHVSLCLHRNFGSNVVNHQRCTPKAFSEVNLAFLVVKSSELWWCHNKITMDVIQFRM